jgi:hypothetical protein
MAETAQRPPAAEADFRRVRLTLAPADHKRLRLLAAEAGEPMSRAARKIVEAALAQPREESRQ